MSPLKRDIYIYIWVSEINAILHFIHFHQWSQKFPRGPPGVPLGAPGVPPGPTLGTPWGWHARKPLKSDFVDPPQGCQRKLVGTIC